MIETQNMPLGPYEPDEEAEPDAGTMALAACLGPGTPGEPTPLDALETILTCVRFNQSAGMVTGVTWEQLERGERLARELRAALGRAGGEGL